MPSESLTWQLCPVVRASFHAVLHSGIDAVSLAAAMQEFSQTVEGLRQTHQLLTASLFRYQAHLFLYLESVGTALAPDGLSPLLDALLCPWPAAVGEALPRRWVAMQPYFYHDIPTTAGDWLRERHTENGLWRTIVDDETSYEEVSASAGIAAAMIAKGNPLHIKYINKSIPCMLANVSPDGRVLNVSGGTAVMKDADGYRSISRDWIQGWGQGLALAFFAGVLNYDNVRSDGAL